MIIKVIGIQKVTCRLPNCTANVITQLPHEVFELEAFSLTNAYVQCIGEQLINALNDPGRLGLIFNGLIQHILAKYGGVEEIPRIKQNEYIRSSTTQTLFFLKKLEESTSKVHTNFQLHTTKSEHEWRAQAINILSHLNSELSFDILHQLLIHNIYTTKHITFPNRTNFMTSDNFKTYYKTPTKLEKMR